MLHRKLAVIPALLVIAAVPALAIASPPSSTPSGKTPGPNASLPAKAKAYGKYCQAESKKHVKGMKGTPFSQCIKAAAQMNKAEPTPTPTATATETPTATPTP